MLSLRTDLPEDRIQVSENQKTYEIRPSDPRIGRFRYHHFLVIFATQRYRVSLRRFLQTRSNWSKATTNFPPVSSIRRSRMFENIMSFNPLKSNVAFFSINLLNTILIKFYFLILIERIWLIFFHHRVFHLESIIWWNFIKNCRNYKKKWRIVAQSRTG